MGISLETMLAEKKKELQTELDHIKRIEENPEEMVGCQVVHADAPYGDFCLRTWGDVGYQEFVEAFVDNGEASDPLKVVRDLFTYISENGGTMWDVGEPESAEELDFDDFFDVRMDPDDNKDKGFVFEIRFDIPRRAFDGLSEPLGTFKEYLEFELDKVPESEVESLMGSLFGRLGDSD